MSCAGPSKQAQDRVVMRTHGTLALEQTVPRDVMEAEAPVRPRISGVLCIASLQIREGPAHVPAAMLTLNRFNQFRCIKFCGLVQAFQFFRTCTLMEAPAHGPLSDAHACLSPRLAWPVTFLHSCTCVSARSEAEGGGGGGGGGA